MSDKETPQTPEPKTDAELRQLAVDLVAGQVFTDQQLNDPHLLPSVFMPLALMDRSQTEHFVSLNPALVYEYLDKAGPMSINGYPSFFSFQFLDGATLERFAPMVNELIAQKAQFLSAGGAA